jgi:hypothetical protein
MHASEDTRFVAELEFDQQMAAQENDAEMQDVELAHDSKEAAKDRKHEKDNPPPAPQIPAVPGQARQALNRDRARPKPKPAGGGATK